VETSPEPAYFGRSTPGVPSIRATAPVGQGVHHGVPVATIGVPGVRVPQSAAVETYRVALGDAERLGRGPKVGDPVHVDVGGHVEPAVGVPGAVGVGVAVRVGVGVRVDVPVGDSVVVRVGVCVPLAVGTITGASTGAVDPCSTVNATQRPDHPLTTVAASGDATSIATCAHPASRSGGVDTSPNARVTGANRPGDRRPTSMSILRLLPAIDYGESVSELTYIQPRMPPTSTSTNREPNPTGFHDRVGPRMITGSPPYAIASVDAFV